MQKRSFDRDAARRRVILDAARDCILKFGYAKSSLEDIAKQAAVSRPLIYRKFKSKEEIFGAVLEDLFETQYRAAEHALASREADGKSLCRSMKLCCLTRGGS
jgi:AcrR family transcriptional regulator